MNIIDQLKLSKKLTQRDFIKVDDIEISSFTAKNGDIMMMMQTPYNIYFYIIRKDGTRTGIFDINQLQTWMHEN